MPIAMGMQPKQRFHRKMRAKVSASFSAFAGTKKVPEPPRAIDSGRALKLKVQAKSRITRPTIHMLPNRIIVFSLLIVFNWVTSLPLYSNLLIADVFPCFKCVQARAKNTFFSFRERLVSNRRFVLFLQRTLQRCQHRCPSI